MIGPKVYAVLIRNDVRKTCITSIMPCTCNFIDYRISILRDFATLDRVIDWENQSEAKKKQSFFDYYWGKIVYS